MKTWVGFFRGINVGGNNMLPMKSLAALMTKLGYQDVQTYIQSGNVIFRSDKSNVAEIEKHIAIAVAKARGFQPRVLVLSRSDLKKAIEDNPFPNATANHKSLHLWFLSAPCKQANLTGIEKLKATNESFVLTKKIFYFHAPDGIGKSKVAGRVEELLGVEATARNWQTVTKVSELAG
jgi:uncharacterized protein (DUF1697 family)